MTELAIADTVRLVINPTSGGGPNVRITGLPAVLLLLAVFGALGWLIWRFFYYRKRARSIAAKADMQYRSLFESSPVGMFLYDTRTQQVIGGNPAFCEVIGYSPDEITSLNLRDLFPADVVAETARVYGSGEFMPPQLHPIITSIRRKDGQQIYIDARGRPMDPELGHARVVMCMDVSEQIAAEKALRDSEQQARSASELVRSIVDVAPQAIIGVDLTGRVTLWNRAAEVLFGWSGAEVIGEQLPILSAEERDTVADRFQSVMKDGVAGPTDTIRRHKDGSLIPLLGAAGLLRDARGNPAGYVIVYTDVRQYRALEEQLRQSQKLEAVGRLAGGVAHDFNNMLTIITAYVQMLSHEHPNDELTQPLAEIQSAASRAAALTRQLLTFSRRQVVKVQTVDVTELVGSLEPMLRRVSAANIRLETDLNYEAGCVSADPAQLEQVLVNLAMNAMDAMPDGGLLSIATSRVILDAEFARTHPQLEAGSYSRISVTDTGTGMDEETLSKIFEPFFTTKPSGQGTGLGLAIAYSVVKQVNGHITVSSEAGKGTTFTIYLPRVAAPGGRPTPSTNIVAVPSGGTVLLVEDDDAVRRSVHATLLRLGYEVLEADSGKAALDILSQVHGPIVVLTDLMMPGMTGRELSERIAVLRPDTRVLFMSGYTDDEVLRRQLVDAGQQFLQKPFSTEQLVAAIETG